MDKRVLYDHEKGEFVLKQTEVPVTPQVGSRIAELLGFNADIVGSVHITNGQAIVTHLVEEETEPEEDSND